MSGHSVTKRLTVIAALATVYFGSAQLGLSLASAHHNVSLIWPSTGIALAAVLLLGYWVWPAVALGAFLANAATGVSLFTAGGIAAGNTLEALGGAFLVRYLIGHRNPLDQAQDVFRFVGSAVLLSTMVSATIGAASLCLGMAASWSDYGQLWWAWWLGDAAGALVVTPAVLAWNARRKIARDPRQVAEAVLLLVLLTLVSYTVFAGWISVGVTNLPLVYLPVPFLIWAAVRFHQRTMTTAILLSSGIAIWGTAHGLGPFARGTTLNESLFLLHTFVGITAVMSLVMAAVITERKQAEATQLASQEQYKLLVDQARDVIYRTDDQGRFTFVNPIVTRIMGYSSQELLGRRFIELIRPDARAAAERFYGWQSVRKTPSTYYEFPALAKDGREIWIGQNVQVLLENGQVAGFHAVARDITERKRAEEARRESEMQIRLFMEATTDCIWNWDLVAAHVTRNVGFERLFGYAAEEIVPTIDWWAERLHPDDRERVWAAYGDTIANGRTTCTYEYRFRRRDGSYAIVCDHVFIVRDDTGKVVRALGAMTDITERKRAEEALRESETFKNRILENSPDCIKVLDLEGRLLFMNKGGQELMEIRDIALLLNSQWFEFWKGKDKERACVAVEAARTGNADRFAGFCPTATGKPKWWDVLITPLLDANGAPDRLLAISRDITERKQAEELILERARLSSFAAEVSLTLNRDASTDEILRLCVEAAARDLGMALARIWTVEPGDLCEECHKAAWCANRTECLHLRASAGLSTNLNGEYRRMPLGALKIGRIAQGMGAIHTNDVLGDERLPNKDWIRENGLQSFAGFPLTIEGTVFGVMAVFAKVPLSKPTLQTLESICNGIAAAVARKRAEEVSRRSQQRYEELVRSVDGIVWEADAKTFKFSFVSPQAERLLGYPVERWLAEPNFWIDHIHPKDREWAKNFCGRATREKRDHEFQYRMMAADGRLVWLHDFVTVVTENDQAVKLRGLLVDITERKQAEEALKESEERFQAFMTHSPTVAFMKDEAGRHVYINRTFERLFHVTRSQIIGKTDFEWLPEALAKQLHDNDRKVFSSGQPLEVVETVPTPDGRSENWLVLKFPLSDASGQRFLGGVAVDITARKRTEKILQALLEGTASVTGEQFFPALVRALAGALGVRHAFVTELLGDEQPRLRILAIWTDDQLGSPTEYDLARTPCENVIKLGEAYYQHSVQELFPEDKDLVAFGAVGYLGIALTDSSGKTIGHLCILDDKPLPDEHHITPLLKVFASRAAAELERKRVDEALRESEKRFRTIFDQAPHGIAVIHSASGHFRRINQKYCEIVGYPHKEMLTRTFQDITHPDDLQTDLDNMTLLMEGRTNTFRMEKRYIRKDGTIVWVNLVCVPLWWDYETEGRFHIAMVEDITERKRTEEVQEQLVAELAESRSRFEMFFRQTPSAIAITTIKEGRFLDLNKEAEILTGYSQAELIGRTTLEMNLYVDPAERAAVVQRLSKTGILTDLERQIRTKSGEIRTAVFSLVPIQMGSEPCMLSIAHDITERKRAEAALRERSRQQAIEAELSLLAVTTADLSTLLNTAAGLAANALELDYCEVLELLPNGRDLLLRAGVGWKDELIGQAKTDMNPSSLAYIALSLNDPVIVQDLPAETRFSGPSWLRDHGIVSGISVTIHGKEGHWGTLGVYTTRQRRFSRDDINFLQTVASILATAIERTQAEDVLRNANEALRRLSRQLLQVQEEDRRAIARDLHDEIGQSLTAIKLNVERAQRTPDRTARTRIMRDCGQITDNVLEQVRDLSLNLHPSILDDLGLAYALKWYADRQAERAGLRIQVAADPSLPRLSHDIEIACFRIAQEALTNIVRHAKASRASVTLTRGMTSVTLAILDDGVGFVVDAIVPQTTAKTSIGLTSMQERARLLGGEVKITSVPTQGTEVIATLPLASSAEAPSTEASRS